MANDRKTFTHPSKPGADQKTTFIQTGFGDPMEETPKVKIVTETVTRGENRYAQYPINR